MKTFFFTATLIVFATNAAAEMPELAVKHGCTACHSIEQKGKGPSWREVALQYRNKTEFVYSGRHYSVEDGLVRKVSFGGRNNWGHAIMRPNDMDELQQDDIRQLVRFILRLPDTPEASPHPASIAQP